MKRLFKAVLCLTLSLPLLGGDAAAQMAAVKLVPASAGSGAGAAALATPAPGLLSRAALGLGATLLAVCSGCSVLSAPTLSEETELTLRLARRSFDEREAYAKRDAKKYQYPEDTYEYLRIRQYNEAVYEAFLAELQRGGIKSASEVEYFQDMLIDKDVTYDPGGDYSEGGAPRPYGVMGAPVYGSLLNTKLRVKQAILAAWAKHKAEIEAARSARVLSDPRLGR